VLLATFPIYCMKIGERERERERSGGFQYSLNALEREVWDEGKKNKQMKKNRRKKKDLRQNKTNRQQEERGNRSANRKGERERRIKAV
jgi:hypothetical protein